MKDLALGLLLTVIAYSENWIVVVTREAVVASVSYSSDEYNIGLMSRRSNVYFTSQGTLAALDRESLGSKIGVNVDLTILKSCLCNGLKIGINCQDSGRCAQRY